jgi:hypothetical protein
VIYYVILTSFCLRDYIHNIRNIKVKYGTLFAGINIFTQFHNHLPDEVIGPNLVAQLNIKEYHFLCYLLIK